MRLNQYIARSNGISRRAADDLIKSGQVSVNGETARLGQPITDSDKITIDSILVQPKQMQYFLMHKPVGYVCSQQQQGDTPTIYSLLPKTLSHLQVAGRLDADSSGLLLLTNDGDYAHQMTHPKFMKQKSYTVTLDKPLVADDAMRIEEGIDLEDGTSSLQLSGSDTDWNISMHEGRNRQIRRTFEAIGYKVVALHRIGFGPFTIDNLAPKEYHSIDKIL